MRAKIVFVTAALAMASAAVAQGASAPTTASLTASAARKAHVMRFADGNQDEIFQIDAGPNDSLAAVEVVENSMAVKIPGDTVSAGDKPRELKTSLTSKEAMGRQ